MNDIFWVRKVKYLDMLLPVPRETYTYKGEEYTLVDVKCEYMNIQIVPMQSIIILQ
jgi:hypothetical protein